MPSFISLDGEGLTRSDGSHDYVLLAASDGRYLEDYSEGGISTERAFEFLLDTAAAHKGEILVGFYTSYDVNMIFRDLPEYVLQGIWEGGVRTWRAKTGDMYQYRIEYVPNRCLKVRQGAWIWGDEIDGERKATWKTWRSVTWWDCFQFFQMSFVKALRDWKAAPDDVIDRIASMKDKRGGFEDSERVAIRNYCFDEIHLLSGMMDKVAATLEALEINLTSWYGAGSIASALFRRYGVKHHLRRDWEPDLDDAIMRAYFGGRVETFAVGIVEAASYNYDVRSAYPAAIQHLPSLKDSIVQERSSYDYNEKWGVWLVHWERIGTRPIRFTPFPFRKNKRIFWPHTGEGWYHAEEVRAAMDVFGDGKRGIKLTVIKGYAIIPSNNERPFHWMPEMYEARAEYKRKGDAREKPLKLGYNSGYGKMAQSIGGRDGAPPAYQCFFWAGAVTADCRAKLMRAASLAGDDLLAIATDGLFTRRPVVLDERDELGAWESTPVEAGLMLIQPGVYATPSLGKEKGGFAKSRGFSAKGLNYEALKTAWEARRMSAAIEIPETRFIGFGYALAVGKLQEQWRRWIAGIKTIHFSGTTSKSIDPRSDPDGLLIRLCAPPSPGDISAPYVPRTRSKDDAKEYELQAELLASQPELEDNPFTWRE